LYGGATFYVPLVTAGLCLIALVLLNAKSKKQEGSNINLEPISGR
jgi:hypothetical protein